MKKPLQLTKSTISIFAIVMMQGVVSLVALRNTAFQDEALYLYAGRQIFLSWTGGPPVAEHYGRFFAGFPELFPVIGGVLDMLGGIEAARLFNLFCLMGVTFCLYYITSRLFTSKSAIFAASLFAFQAPILFLGRLATHDALSFFFVAASSALAVYIGKARSAWSSLLLGPVVVLAVATKFVALLYIPIIFWLLIDVGITHIGWKRLFVRVFFSIYYMVIIGALLLLNLDRDVLTGLQYTTTNRIAFIKTPPLELLGKIVPLSGIMYLLGFFGVWVSGKRRALLSFFLLGTSLLAPLYHIYKGEFVSLDKHLGFSIFFITPLAGNLLSRIAGSQKSAFLGRYWFAGLGFCLVVFSFGIKQAQALYHDWPSTDKLTHVLRTQVRSQEGHHYLAETFEVPRYYLQDITVSWQWVGLDFFEYTDKKQRFLSGNEAYTAAVDDGYFDLIVLNFGYNSSLANVINAELRKVKKYELISKIPYDDTYGNGYFWVWRRVPFFSNQQIQP